MSILPPTSESHAHFQNLVDYHQHDQHIQHNYPHHHHYDRQPQQVYPPHPHTVASAEWPMYSPTEPHPPQTNNDALSRATKDLMSLESDSWNSGSNNQQQNQSSRPHYHVNYSHLPPPQPRRNVSFPFLAKPLAITPYSQSSAAPSLPTPSTSSSSASGSSYSYHLPTPSSPTSPTQPIRTSRSPKRSLDASAQMSESKRQRPSLSHTLSMPPHPSTSYSRLPASPVLPSLLPPVITSSSKPALLSPSQKKANHIQSEQKRRANIRRGYEALCDTVPALREAIRAEDEAMNGKAAKAARAKRSRAKSAKGEDTQPSGDKIDGRAGPRSENVVLLKTIDYINELTSERSDLLARLERARNALPVNHPALQQSSNSSRIPLWEREWKGGEPKQEEDEEEEEE